MNPISDLKGEHDAMGIILTFMKKMISEINEKRHVDLFKVRQIIEFIQTYCDCCHHEKEEKIFFPTILECEIPWTKNAIRHLVNEHLALHSNLSDIDIKLQEYLSGFTQTLDSMAVSLTKYVSLCENHIYTENNILLPLAEKTLSKQQQHTIYADFKLIQDTKVGHAKHLEYYILLTRLYSDVKVSYADDFEEHFAY